MLSKSHILLLCLLILQFTSVAIAAPGFLTSDGPSIPRPVANASKSVFKFSVPDGRLNRVVHLDNLSEVQKATTDFSNDDKFWEKGQLEFCQRTSEKICPIFDQLYGASAFILGQGDQLYTNLHNVFKHLSTHVTEMPKLSREKLKKALMGKNLFFDLSADGQSLFETVAERTGKLLFFNPDRQLLSDFSELDTPLGQFSDVVRFQLRRTLGRPLQFAKARANPGETVYLIGFPAETHDRKFVGAKDSDGKSLRISVGQVVARSEWKKLTGESFHPEVERILRQTMIYTDADCTNGNSGGPLVNAEGEVVGIVTSTYNGANRSSRKNICFGLSIFDEKSLMELWDYYTN